MVSLEIHTCCVHYRASKRIFRLSGRYTATMYLAFRMASHRAWPSCLIVAGSKAWAGSLCSCSHWFYQSTPDLSQQPCITMGLSISAIKFEKCVYWNCYCLHTGTASVVPRQPSESSTCFCDAGVSAPPRDWSCLDAQNVS